MAGSTEAARVVAVAVAVARAVARVVARGVAVRVVEARGEGVDWVVAEMGEVVSEVGGMEVAELDWAAAAAMAQATAAAGLVRLLTQ